jgi:hypothetical protein
MKILRKILASLIIFVGLYLSMYSHSEWSTVFIVGGSLLFSKGFLNEQK